MIDHGLMMWRVLFVVLVVGCTKPNPRSCVDGTCTDPAFPFCDVNGEVEGQSSTCIAVECTAGEFQACRDDLAITCNGTGTDFDLLTCDRGCDEGVGCRLCDASETACTNGTVATCDAAGEVVESELCPLGCFEDEPRCREIASSNSLDEYVDLTRDAIDLDLSAGGVIDTRNGTIRDANNSLVPVTSVLVPAAPGGAPIRVFIAKRVLLGNVQIESGVIPGVEPAPALAIVAGADVVISGTVSLWSFDAEGFRAQPGAMNIAGCNGGDGIEQHPTSPSQDLFSGSGGGAHATPGGKGGEIEFQLAGALGGVGLGNPTLVPLRGGCDGGIGRGGGGGAIQITSRASITITEGALINANGNAGTALFGGPGPLGGGGAGGGILLEAPTIELRGDAKLLVNGGPGAADGEFNTAISTSRAASPGGTCATAGGFVCGNAGNGAGADGPATNGALVPYSNSPTLTRFTAGSGGGGLGFIRLVTATGDYVKSSGVTESGTLSTSIVETR
jgi:hypothetical protein